VVICGTHTKVYRGEVLVATYGHMHDHGAGGDKTMYGVRARLRRAGYVL
jgi:hypothetical protein